MLWRAPEMEIFSFRARAVSMAPRMTATAAAESAGTWMTSPTRAGSKCPASTRRPSGAFQVRISLEIPEANTTASTRINAAKGIPNKHASQMSRRFLRAMFLVQLWVRVRDWTHAGSRLVRGARRHPGEIREPPGENRP